MTDEEKKKAYKKLELDIRGMYLAMLRRCLKKNLTLPQVIVMLENSIRKDDSNSE